jgi:hypothetical protein
LTKVFIVFHVVLSLLLAAGLIVFVNRTEDFKATKSTLEQQLGAAKTQLNAAQSEASRQAGYAALARQERDSAYTDAAGKATAAATTIADLKTQLAEAKSNYDIGQVAMNNVTSALTASETARKALADILETTRTDSNTLATKNSQLNLAVADLTNKLEVAVRQVTNLNETVAQLKLDKERADKLLVQAGGTPGAEVNVNTLAPAINGVILNTRMQGGIPYATISVGSQADVKAGMKFNVVDREKGNFLGELTVEQVDEKEATGRLEGPRLSDIQDGKTEVKTQL